MLVRYRQPCLLDILILYRPLFNKVLSDSEKLLGKEYLDGSFKIERDKGKILLKLFHDHFDSLEGIINKKFIKVNP